MTQIRAPDPEPPTDDPYRRPWVGEYRHPNHEGRRYCPEHGSLEPKLPLPTASDEADYHKGAQWHRCVRCGYTYVCWSSLAHGHPGCRGKNKEGDDRG